MFKYLTSAGFFLALACGVAHGQSTAQAQVDRNGTQLECKPRYVTSADGHDPIVSIRLTLSDGNAQVIHIAQSGQTFNRADQYSVNSAVWSNNQFTWSGRNNKKTTVTMVGTAKPMTGDDKWFSYTESVFEGGSVNKTYEMFSVCAITSQPPKKQAGLVVVVPKAGQVSPAEADADARHPFGFRRLIIDTTGEAPEACFRFSRALDPHAEARYGDYVRIQPEASIALRIANTDLCVNGLASGTDYKVTLAKGLLSKSGDRTENAETVDVNLGDKPSRVSISGDGYILPRNTSNGLAIQTVNVHNLKIRVLRMSDRLVLSNKDVLQNNTENSASRYYYTQRYTIENGGLQRYQLRELVKQAASLIWSGTMEIVRDHNRTIQTAFPLAGIIKSEQPGAYLVIAEDAANAMPDKELSTVAASDEQNVFWRDLYETIPAHWVMVTDIALTAMTGADGLHVSARSLKSAEPLAGVKVTLLATGQDQLGQATTDANGSATFGPGLLRGHGASAAATITAYGAQGDFAILNLNRAAFDLSDRGVSGRPSPGPSEAFVYADRGVYRPGETVEVVALLRDRLGDGLINTPLTLVLRRPDGVAAKRFSLDPALEAGFHQSIPLSKTAAFGQWSVEALVDPVGEPIGRVQFNVQDFVPQTLKVTLKPSATALDLEEPIALAVDGQFLYGAPAAGLKGEAEAHIVRDMNPVANAKGYSFGLLDEKFEEKIQRLEMPAADDSGHVDIVDQLEPPIAETAPLKAVISAGLFEPSGRIVKDEVELPIHSQHLLIGLKPRFSDNRAEEGKNAIVDVRTFDASGKPKAQAGLHWSLVRENRVYDWFEMNKTWRWHYHTTDEEIASGTLNVPEGAPAILSQLVSWGQYRLVVDDPETKAATSIRFVAGWAQTAESADTPDKVEVSLEKPTFKVGETARLRVKGPFAGKAQLTIAGDRVFETRQIDIAKDGTTIEVKPTPDWGGGAYAIVSLYRPLASGRAHDPVRAVGLAWMGLDVSQKTLSVAISAPDKIAPRQLVNLSLNIDGVKAGEQTYVTLAAVDEGILQLTRYETPDPVKFLFGKRRLGFDIRDDYARLLDGSADSGTIHQGGDGGDKPIGGQPLEVTSTRTVALFAGPVQIQRDGTAQITLDVPDFEGQLRLMAVAYSRHAVGHGEQKLIVRDPVIADLSLPRFLAPGDTARLALSLHNTDGTPGSYHLAISADRAASLITDHALDYKLAAGERKSDAVVLKGLDAGVSTISADLSGPNGYKAHREWQIAIRAPHYPIAIEDTTRQAPGESFSLNEHQLDGLVPGSVTVSVGYSSFAGIDVPSLLQSLYRYPYGCTEQITSIAFPLLYYNDPGLLGNLKKDEGVRDRVKRTIETLMDRQGASGKFGLWRANDGLASVWLNVYALDFLQHAREAGFDVQDASMQRGFNWLSQSLPQLENENSGYYSQGPQATRAYAFYVMARAGRADPRELRSAFDPIGGAKLVSGYTLASFHWQGANTRDTLAQSMSLGQLGAALTLMGDHVRGHNAFEMALANLGVREHPAWWFNSFYYTEIQDAAALLAVAAEVGDDDVARRALEKLVALRPSSEKLNTQEKAWILAAVHSLNRNDPARSFDVNGKTLTNVRLPAAFAPTLDDLRKGYTIANTGQRDLWRTVVIRGAPTSAPSAMEVGYTIKRTYFTLDGRPLDPSHLRQNDRLIVSIEGKSADGEEHQTVLVDMLPAGWEIEGPVTPVLETPKGDAEVDDTNKTYGFLGALTNPHVTEARDDRFVAAFTLGHDASQRFNRYFAAKQTLPEAAFHLAYVVRVITPGNFTLPEAVVEDMYRPSMMARTDSGQTIADPR
jgi:uncharacterized protein YfaS (alpha-2-macroglobulin family)